MIARRVPLPALQLRSGVVIADPLADAYRFIEVDGTYQRYDQAVGGGDDEVTEADVHIANQIIARMGPRETTAILSRAERLHSALGVLPVTTTLVNPPQEIPWSAIEDLYDAMSGLPGIGLARATKVLHKKRPSLIPILDEVVQRYLAAVDRPISGSLAARGVSLTRSYQRELLHQLPILQLISSRLIEDGYFLTECRLLDIYLWAYSGVYEPLWERSHPRRSTSRLMPPHAGGAGTRSESVTEAHDSTGGVETYVNNGRGYLAWLAAHPASYVLNCARRPKADYLKLHRSSCPHVNRVTTRSWTTTYQKVCSDSAAALDAWAATSTGGHPDRCPICSPS